MRELNGSTLLVALVLALTGCGEDEASGDTTNAAASASTTTAAAPSATASAEETKNPKAAAWAACQTQLDATKAKPGLPGTPRFEEQRVHMTRVRGKSMFWRRPPEARPAHDEFLKKKTAVKVVRAIRAKLRKFKSRREERRDYVLREGYLWHHDVRVALALVEQVSLPKIFKEKTVYLQRGVDIWKLEWRPRDKLHHERFVYMEGPYEGEKAEVLLGDRVALTREELEETPPLHLDLRDLMDRSRFDRIKPVHLTDDALVAELRYGPDVWVPALVKLTGAKMDVSCEALTPELDEKKQAFLTATESYHFAMKRLNEVVRSMVREQIPFDADEGQSMGFLRKAWDRAYFKGWKRFDYEGELREVYSRDGQAIPPQVCIDFLTDAWERAGGKWFVPMQEGEPKPKRTEGVIDFDELGVDNRRSVAKFTEFTQKHDEYFDVWAIPKDERFLFRDRDEFFAYLKEAADMFRPGDMVSVHGYKHGGRPHYHSLLILELDPITGVISLIASNAVFPREQTLEGILHISPKRSFRHRIRIKEPWLDAIAKQVKAADG